jgi:hypothetical protein
MPGQLGIDEFHPKQLVIQHRYRAFELSQRQTHRNFLHVICNFIMILLPGRVSEPRPSGSGYACVVTLKGLVLHRRLFPVVVPKMRSQHVIRNADVIQDPGGQGLERFEHRCFPVAADGIG